jgi:hypothetical protein
MPEFKDIIQATPLLAFLLIAYYAYRRGLPDWKEVQLARIQLQREDIAMRKEEATAIGSLASSLVALSGIFTKVDDTTTELKLFLRAAMRQHDLIEERVSAIERHVAGMRAGKQQ